MLQALEKNNKSKEMEKTIISLKKLMGVTIGIKMKSNDVC